jgi:hypothetical protein
MHPQVEALSEIESFGAIINSSVASDNTFIMQQATQAPKSRKQLEKGTQNFAALF